MFPKSQERSFSWGDLGHAYTNIQPMLWHALARLGRQGYRTNPDEGLDPIHDFFVEAWHKLEKNYNPERAKFTSYVYGAFLHFARRRIVESTRWQCQLMTLERDPRENTIKDEYEYSDLDRSTVRSAFRALPSRSREVLRQRLLCGRSEREVATLT
jgi:RNA polymerase sigma factor (sigma-70 family)